MTAAFYFDLASPDAYLAAERILGELPGPAQWTPVLAHRLADGVAPSDAGDRLGTGGGAGAGDPVRAGLAEGAGDRERIARRARDLGLQELRWPQPFPFDSTLAMRVATYARQIGRVVAFSQAAFRQAFAGGRSLADEDSVLIAAAACEMHPAAVLAAAGMRSVIAELEQATMGARASGVRGVPAVLVPGAGEGGGAAVFHGESSLAQAAACMRRRSGVPGAGEARGRG
ncbi:MAG TPA: DsbA family protein [Solirubrobacteraceae bacterium]|nr:DsbA family protein [Solirubrobacteraceae bacterium]